MFRVLTGIPRFSLIIAAAFSILQIRRLRLGEDRGSRLHPLQGLSLSTLMMFWRWRKGTGRVGGRWGCPVTCSMLNNSILDLCPLDSSSNFLPRDESQKCPQTWPQIPAPEWSTINPQVEKPLFQMYDFLFQEVNWFKKICLQQVLILCFPASQDLLD